MRVVQSRTRRRDSASGFSKLCSWRRMDSRYSGYSLAWSLRPAYTSSGLSVGTAGQGATFGVAISMPPADVGLAHCSSLSVGLTRELSGSDDVRICLWRTIVKRFQAAYHFPAALTLLSSRGKFRQYS